MAHAPTTTQAHAAGELEPSYLDAKQGLRHWLVTLDHKRIGVMYLFGIIIAFLVGGTFALLIRAELFFPGKQLVDEDQYNQLFTLHGAIMVFLVIIPGLPAAIGNFNLPIQLGAPDVAFPRLNLASFYLWCTGAALLLISLFTNAVDTGWTFYTPYSTTTGTAVLPALAGVFVLGFSSIFTGLNFIVTIHKFRPKGMSWFKMPLNLWGIYSTALLQVLATPVIGITVLLLLVERTLHIGIFDPALGGDPVLFQHFFWFYSHPAVYIMILPAMAAMSELITTFSHKPMFGYRFIAYSSIALASLSFLVWGHHMFVSGQSRLAGMVFSALTMTVAVPSAIKVFNWIATMYKANITLKTPMLYAISFILLFTIGGLTGVFLGALSVDVHLHDTYFVVAHFHYVMMGSTLVAFLGALHYWWPKFTGRMYPESLGRLCSLGVFFGFNLTFMPQFVMGARGMPRRYWDYDPMYQTYHQLSTIGAYVLGISLFITVVYLLRSFKHGPRAPRNPWGATTLEWQAPTPPPLYNFEKPPILHEIYNYDDLVEVEPDVWERQTPIEDEPARADEIARKIGAAAEHTGGATAAEKLEAQARVRMEELADRPGEAKAEEAKLEDAKALRALEAKAAAAEAKAAAAAAAAAANGPESEAKAEQAKQAAAEAEAKVAKAEQAAADHEAKPVVEEVAAGEGDDNKEPKA
jgi:cytochrome c oxidase subunit 1